MSVLAIDDEKLTALREYAEAHPIPIAEIRKIIAGTAPCAGDRDGHVLNMDVGYRLVYSIEEMPADGETFSEVPTETVWFKRMSMSAQPGRLPNKHAIRLVSERLGFPPLEECIAGVVDGAVMVVAKKGELLR